MPRQNRVDPWSRIVADPARGAWMGNRGCLHDGPGQIRRTHQGIRWIICRLDFRGRRRALLQPGRYTELFFLDEATALAAGHRPCAECQRARYHHFVACWALAQGLDATSVRASTLDATLHRARFAAGQKLTYTASPAELPDGVMVAGDPSGPPLLVWHGRFYRWSFGGYLLSPASPAQVEVLTPRPTVALLAAGYPVQVHPSCENGGVWQ
jgi:hypothetical protein